MCYTNVKQLKHASFGEASFISVSNLGLNDTADQKVRTVGSKAAQGKISIDDFINSWNTIE